MSVIGILFGCIVYLEVRYLRQKHRKRRTYVIVVSTAVILFFGLELLFYMREQWTITIAIERLFGPIDRMIMRVEK
ncbi:hypothetical protein [Cohnella sp. WQ 127256]|uniref:hypothetical protein n=1 Tax=Cohnella sp. WQ 127256 TaxID=2938790 RepID=UPI00211874EE|nr:hypothetical protein [Cohnella sp. WQ 127256]